MTNLSRFGKGRFKPKSKSQRKRFDFIKRECVGKRILDVGCVSESVEGWLHGELCEVAERCVGIDIQTEKVEEMRKKKYEVFCVDAESFKFGERFDVVVLGELIEHVSNPGLVLDRCREHLLPDGKLIVSTLNPFNPGIFRKYELTDAETDHVMYHPPRMFKRLAERHGFRELKIEWIKEDWLAPPSIRGKIYTLLMNLLLPKRFSAIEWVGVCEWGF